MNRVNKQLIVFNSDRSNWEKVGHSRFFQYSAYNLYVNSELITSNGFVGMNSTTHQMKMVPEKWLFHTIRQRNLINYKSLQNKVFYFINL